MNRTILSIGGFDPSCADGLAADIKTCSAYRCYCVGVLTTVTAQNSQGVQAVQPVPMEFIAQQVESLAPDMEIHAVKTGMLGRAKAVEIVSSLIDSYSLPHLVVDPTIEASPSGAALIDEEGLHAMQEHLLPKAELLVANLAEASIFAGMEVQDVPTMKQAAKVVHERHGPKAVVITGGHLPGTRAMDVLFDGSHLSVHDAAKITTNHTRGVGTTFSTALAVHITRGLALSEGINKAKQYLQKAMSHPFTLTEGPGPLNHTVPV